jgi:integrase/recombinase XerD
MTVLRQQMIDAMQQRGFAQGTQQSYLGAVNGLARYFNQPLDRLRAEQIQVYFNYLVQERGLSGASCRLYFHGIRYVHWVPTYQQGGIAFSDLVGQLGGEYGHE